MRSLISSAGGAGTGGGWSALWQKGLTLWDLGGPTATLLDEFTKASTDGRLPSKNARVFVPGCGSGYDVAALAKTSFAPIVTGLDIAPEAIERARSLGLADTVPGTIPGTTLICGDFFTHPLDPFDLVFDYTFFCALPPAMRGRWGERTAALVKPGGRLLTLAFPLAPDETALDPDAKGPPFPVSEAAYSAALEKHGLVKESGPYRSELSAREAEMVLWWKKR